VQRLVKLLAGRLRHAVLPKKTRRHPERCRRKGKEENLRAPTDAASARAAIDPRTKLDDPEAVSPPRLLPLTLGGVIVGWIRARAKKSDIMRPSGDAAEFHAEERPESRE